MRFRSGIVELRKRLVERIRHGRDLILWILNDYGCAGCIYKSGENQLTLQAEIMVSQSKI